MTSHEVCSSKNEANFESLENLLKLTVAKFCEKFQSFINSRIAGAQLDGGRGEGREVSPALFQKLEKEPQFWKKNALIMGYIFHAILRFSRETKQSFTLLSCGVDRMFIDVP